MRHHVHHPPEGIRLRVHHGPSRLKHVVQRRDDLVHPLHIPHPRVELGEYEERPRHLPPPPPRLLPFPPEKRLAGLRPPDVQLDLVHDGAVHEEGPLRRRREGSSAR